MITEETEKKANALFSSPIMMIKKSKSGEKEVHITAVVKKISFSARYGEMVINTILSAGSSENLNPEYIVNALKNEGLFSSEAENYYRIMRNRVYDKNLMEFK
jgi:uncharacterized protein (DUF2344 family)